MTLGFLYGSYIATLSYLLRSLLIILSVLGNCVAMKDLQCLTILSVVYVIGWV